MDTSLDTLHTLDLKKWESTCEESPHLFFMYPHTIKNPIPTPKQVVVKNCSLDVLLENVRKYKSKMRNYVVIDFIHPDLPQFLVLIGTAKITISDVVAKRYIKEDRINELYDYSLECYNHSPSVIFELFRAKKYTKKITPALREQYEIYSNCA